MTETTEITVHRLLNSIFNEIMRWFKNNHPIPKNENGKHQYPKIKMVIRDHWPPGSISLTLTCYGSINHKQLQINYSHSETTNQFHTIHINGVAGSPRLVTLGDPNLLDLFKSEIENWWNKIKQFYRL